jgi:hypothetical protein
MINREWFFGAQAGILRDPRDHSTRVIITCIWLKSDKFLHPQE